MSDFQKLVEFEFTQIQKRISLLVNVEGAFEFDEIEHQVSKLRDLRKLALSTKLDPELTREILRAQILASDFLAYRRYKPRS